MSSQQKSKKKNNSRLYILIAAALLLVVMIVLIAVKCSGGKKKILARTAQAAKPHRSHSKRSVPHFAILLSVNISVMASPPQLFFSNSFMKSTSCSTPSIGMAL